ncbi:MAG: DUF3524 domain-containing protein [Sedimentisphaerales bacterium]|nr:DUF3524 domain-containing protein [Sedimentisphaerales bacterium]
MKILALEPYYGGSHKAFIDGVSKSSRHDWTLLELAPYKWKWRMRHSAVTFADQLAEPVKKGQTWDLIFCSDMLNLAEFSGLAPKTVRELPAIVYFHENQLTYPVQIEDERDYQFAMTNITTALAAESVWFNSAFHKNSFLNAITKFLKKMPDCQPIDTVKRIDKKSLIFPPGLNKIERHPERPPGPLRILWAARWEHDKNPDDFFAALKILKTNGISFRLSVLGQQFRQIPEVFTWAKYYFADNIDNWGYQENRTDYEKALTEADVFVSTANHEFFGISAAEAILAGAYPLLPNRLAYPEILSGLDEKDTAKFFYDGSVAALADKLIELSKRIEKDSLTEDTKKTIQLTQRFEWKNLADILDTAIEKIV